MPQNRYFLPDNPRFPEVYTKNDLRLFLQNGELSRSDMVLDDESGKAHFLGDLLAMPYSGTDRFTPLATQETPVSPLPRSIEFRADTPLPMPKSSLPAESEEFDDLFDEEDSEEEPETDDWQPSGESSRESSPLLQNDDLYYIGHPSWFSYPKSILLALLFIGAAVFFHQARHGVEWVILFGCLAALLLVFVSLDRTTTTYFITRRRVEVEFGIIGRNSREARISDIRAIDVYQKGLSAFFGMGTIDFDTAANPGTEVRFINVSRPHDIKQLVRQLQA
ncbi:hypothetical protein BH11VER1_BH11VER1_30310 [soil metagenome]